MLNSCAPGLSATKFFVHIICSYDRCVVQDLCGIQHIIIVSFTVVRQILKTFRNYIQLKPVKILIFNSKVFFLQVTLALNFGLSSQNQVSSY